MNKLKLIWRSTLGVMVGWLVFSGLLVMAIIIYGTRDYARPADVIIVLGSGVEADGSPSRTLQERAGRGADLYHQGVAPVMICTGAVIGLAPRAESDACREVLIGQGVPPEAILAEAKSTNTEENARYALELMAERDMTTAVVVSSRYHLLRARWLFWKQNQHVHTSPAPIGYLTTEEILFSYFREWAAFHWNAVRSYIDLPHVRVPVP